MGAPRQLYLTILEGPSPGDAVPIFSTHDARLIAAVARELEAVLGIEQVPARILPFPTGSDED
jgi:hypothetical protein